MSYIAFFNEITKKDVNRAGGKGASLGEMTNAGIQVPPGFVLLAEAFDRFLQETKLDLDIAAQLKKVNLEDTNSVDKASAVIRDMIHDRPMPDDLTQEMLASFKKLGAEFVAVRSSATAEDSLVASWAGELETYLNTTKETVIERVKRCWSSLFTPRAIFYRHKKNLIDAHVSVAVVVQKMVQSEISGIAFTVHPVTEDYDQMIIEAAYGLGEAIVGGLVTPDSYIVSKSEMSILDISVSEQSRKLVRRKQGSPQKIDDEETGSNEWVELSTNEGGKQKLTGKEIMMAAEAFKNIEHHYGFPCDIEWAMEGGKLYITQSRPITTLKK